MSNDILNTIVGQSPTIAALIFFVYFLIKDRKQTITQREEKDSQQNDLEKEFRKYLMQQSQEHHQLLDQNTKALTRFSNIMEKLFEKL